MLGILFFVLPGIAMMIAPTLLFYSLSFWLVWHLCSLTMPKYMRNIVSALIVGFFAFAIPLATHPAVNAEINALLMNDKMGATPVFVEDSVALLFEYEDEYNKRSYKPELCHELCQRLLYNGATKRVFIRDYLDIQDALKLTVPYFYIERREVCPPANIPEQAVLWPRDDGYNTHGDRKNNAVKMRIAAGECLLQGEARLSEAKMIFTEFVARGTPDSSPNYSREPRDVRARRLELWKNVDGRLEILDRKTQVVAGFLAVPPYFLLRGGLEARNSSVSLVYKSRMINMFHDRVFNEYHRLFGEVVNLPEIPIDHPEINATNLFRAALDKPGDHEGLKLFADFLDEIRKKKIATEEDAELVSRAISDMRIRDFSGLPIQSFKSPPKYFIKSILDRIFISRWPKDTYIIKSLSHAFQGLPEGAAKDFSSELIQLANMPLNRGVAWKAVSRLRDAGPDVALPVYKGILKLPFNSFDGYSGEQFIVLAAIMGLCEMGEPARVLADDLVIYLRGYRVGFSQLAVKTLSNVMPLEEIQKKVGIPNKDIEMAVKRAGCAY